MRKFFQDREVFLKRKVNLFFIRIMNPICLFFCLIWAIPAVFLMRILRPWIYMRVGTFESNRFGHFNFDVGLQWAKLSEKSSNQIDLYWLDWLDGQFANKQWTNMVRRNFKVAWWVRHLDFWNNILPGGKDHHRPFSIPQTRDIHGVLERTKVSMKFLPAENQTAKNWLRQQGWQEGELFVCLLVRDSAYTEFDPQFVLDKEYGSWKYHSYRNSDIATYVSAMEWLADQGVWVLRMGKKMEKPIPSQHKRIIDYTFNPERSDFLDIWLFAHCYLCISTGSGPDIISHVYRRPILFLNHIPLGEFRSWSNSIHTPKILVWEASGKELTFQEYLNHFYFRTENYQQARIKIIDLTPEEILYATQECWQRIKGTWMDTEDDLKKHQQVWDILKHWPEFSEWHGWKHPNSRIGSTWLQARSEIFLTTDKHFKFRRTKVS